jgi:hypothetical protein
MNLSERIESFSSLGKILSDALAGKHTKYTSQLTNLIETRHLKNPWFTPDNVRMAIKAIADEITFENLTKWTDAYPALKSPCRQVRVGIIMAGNIPLAGFHDFLSVLITGNNLVAKTSQKDAELIVLLSEILCDINRGFADKIKLSQETLSEFDAVIATGSDNSSRYFEYYFGRYPNIIRKNRNSVAIIDGSETDTELQNLGTDIFSYFGLGCRNVSKIYVPEGYDFTNMIRSLNSFAGITNHNKYANNYDFNKAVFLINKEKFIDTGYLLLKENNVLSSPVAVLYYEFFKSPDRVNEQLENLKEKIQCKVGRNLIPFGKTQSPQLWDYADGIDTIEFILKKNSAGIL